MAMTARGYLTLREFEVLRWSARGYSSRQIGEVLVITEQTVKTHRRRIFRKLDAENTAHAVAIAYEIGLFKGGTLTL